MKLRLKMAGLLDQLLLLIGANAREWILLEDMELLGKIHHMHRRHLLWIQHIVNFILFINTFKSININFIYFLCC